MELIKIRLDYGIAMLGPLSFGLAIWFSLRALKIVIISLTYGVTEGVIVDINTSQKNLAIYSYVVDEIHYSRSEHGGGEVVGEKIRVHYSRQFPALSTKSMIDPWSLNNWEASLIFISISFFCNVIWLSRRKHSIGSQGGTSRKDEGSG